MKFLLRTAIISIVVVALLTGALGSIRWARRGGTAAAFAANALLLAFGMGLVATPPQRGAEQAQEEDDKTGGESGDPPGRG
jgi:hypothetical protein